MKILYFSPHPHLNLAGSTGYGRHMREIIAALKKNGHDVQTLIVGGETLSESSGETSNGCKKILKKIIPGIIWETLVDYKLIRLDKAVSNRLLDSINKFNPDIIYERGYYLMPSGALIAKKKNIMHILEINGPYVEERIELKGKSLLTDRAAKMEKLQIENTNLLVVVSSPLKSYFTKKYSIDPAKVLVTPNAVNFDDININETRKKELKNKFNLNSKTVIGFVGSIFPYHGVDLLIEAFEILKQKGEIRNLVLLVIGDGETLKDLKLLTINKGLTDNIIFTGKVSHNEVYDYIQLFDIAIMAKTNWYCSPIKIFEYGALKKPIIAPDTQSVKDVMTNNEDGLLVKPNATEIANAINDYANNADKRIKHGISFYNKIKEKHIWQAVAKQIIDTLK